MLDSTRIDKKDFITTILDITRMHNSVANAQPDPNKSLASSQEDLTAIEQEAVLQKRREISDLSKLREDQAKSIERAKSMLKAAFSEDEDD